MANPASKVQHSPNGSDEGIPARRPHLAEGCPVGESRVRRIHNELPPFGMGRAARRQRDLGVIQ